MNDALSASGAAIGTLLRWLRHHGAEIGPLEIAESPENGRFARATGPIAEGVRVVRIPRNLLLSADLASSSAVGTRIHKHLPHLATAHLVLSAFLLSEMRSRPSFWTPYIDVLPKAFPHLPFFQGKKIAALLKGSLAGRRLHDQRQKWTADHRALRRKLPEHFGTVKLSELAWARAAVQSRVFGVESKDHKNESLVPFADLLNHKRPAEVTWSLSNEGDAFVMTTNGPIEAGQSVHDSYGRKCNTRFYVHYGFVLPDNEDNLAQVEVAVRPNDPLLFDKVKWLGQSPKTFDVPARHDSALRGLLSYLRIASATPAEMAWLRTLKLDPTDVPPLGGRNEAAALTGLIQGASRSLWAFETTLEEDRATLRQPVRDPRVRQAIIVRCGEKEVLAALVALAENALPILRLPGQSRRRAVEELAKGHTLLDRYLRAVIRALDAR